MGVKIGGIETRTYSRQRQALISQSGNIFFQGIVVLRQINSRLKSFADTKLF